MKTYDFVFVYEVKNRELENICLLKYELEKRGYSVKLIETWGEIFFRHKAVNAKVVAGFAMYNDDVLAYIDSFVKNCKKYVNLQWEQLTADYILQNDNSSVKIQGTACQAHHISHGKTNREWLTCQCGISPQKVHLTGHISMDFYKPALRNYCMSRSRLFSKYNIPTDKKICLFISSFVAEKLPQIITESDLNKESGIDYNATLKNETESWSQIITWIQNILTEDETLFFVYRPHPAEWCKDELFHIEKIQPRFKVIREEAVKEWILNADKIYVWASTTISEIYAAKKPCGILRPIDIPESMDYELYRGGRYLKSYSDFKKDIYIDPEFPLDKEKLNRYFDIDNDGLSYQRVCDVLEDYYKDNSDIIKFNHKDSFLTEWSCLTYNLKQFIKKIIFECRICAKLMTWLFRGNKKFNYLQHKENYEYSKLMCQNNQYKNSEIEKIMDKIANALNYQDTKA